jgi:two-component system phosphate regulon sensor histidine kinase PhoR
VDTVCAEVRDQGIGVPAEDLPHLFQRFYRASNVSANNISGVGIGLYVVQEIVKMHGGNVTVASEEREGSTFTIRLPRIPVPLGAASEQSAAALEH